jgi:capping protein beta
MRNLLQEVYFGKAKDVVGDLRSTDTTRCKHEPLSLIHFPGIPPLSQTNRDRATQREMINSMGR